LFAVAGVALGVTAGLAGCASSPYAADVNSTTISQDSLNNELHSIAANPAAVRDYRQGGLPVAGSGAGTYNSSWVADVLQQLVITKLVHQELVARHDLPTSADLPAAWAVASLEYGPEWPGFSADYQAVIAERYAELIKLAPVTLSAANRQSVYNRYRSTFYSQVCGNEVAVSRTNPDGSVNDQASLAAALKLQAQINAGTDKNVTGSSLGCVTPSQVEQFPAFEQQLLTTLSVGHASKPYGAAYGYYLIQVTSRTLLTPSDPTTRAALDYLGAQILSQQRNIASPIQLAVINLARDAHVKINPAYGSWHAATAANGAGLGLHAPTSPSVL
jgi:hypothetical protein